MPRIGRISGSDRRKGRHLTRRYQELCVTAILLSSIAVDSIAQGEGEPRGFGQIQLGAPVSTISFPCNHPLACEAPIDTEWVRVWHKDGLIWRADVIYSGRPLDIDEDIQSSPITLAQAIRSHSVRYGQKSPRLGFAGNEGSSRIVVDVANGIVYLAAAVTETSLVTEVRYLPMTDPLVQKASATLLTDHGAWLIRAALLSRRYKNLLAEPDQSTSNPAVQELTRDETAGHKREVASH
jgi:hypothetical protein